MCVFVGGKVNLVNEILILKMELNRHYLQNHENRVGLKT